MCLNTIVYFTFDHEFLFYMTVFCCNDFVFLIKNPRMSEDPAPLWDAELEVCLFQSMQGHKPVGFNKHFHMICIQHKYVHCSGKVLFSF